MTAVQEDIDIRGPIDEVFAALTDPRRIPEWNHSIVEVADLPSDPIQTGSTWRQVALIVGRPTTLQCRVVQYQPPYRGEIEVSGGQQGRIWTECLEGDGVVHVTQGIDFVPPGGMLGRMAAGVMVPMLKKELGQTVRRQRDILERELEGASGPRTA